MEQKLSEAKQEVSRHIFNDVNEDVIPNVFEGGHFQNKDRVISYCYRQVVLTLHPHPIGGIITVT